MSEHPRRRAFRVVPLSSTFALLLLVLFAATAAAQVNHLSSSAVDPRHAGPADVIHFSVLYTDKSGAAPKSVTVVIDGASHAMAKGAGTFAAGVTYTYASTLAVGHHDVVFATTDAKGNRENVGGGSVWIKIASDGSGGQTSGPIGGDPSPGTNNGDAPLPTAGSGGSTGGTGNTPAATPAPTNDDPEAPAATDPAVQPTSNGTAPQVTARATDAAAAATVGAGAGPVGTGNGGSGIAQAGAGTLDGASGADGGTSDLPRGPLPLSALLVAMAPTIAATSAGASAWAAFVIFGKRRRDNTQPAPDEVLATAAATPIETAASEGLRPAANDESMMPRWRRPSLQAARKNDPLRSNAEAPRLTFNTPTAPILPLDGFERRQVRYRLVRLLDSPDELYSTEIGLLDQGDEVQLLERHGVYWRVLCPDGRQGWLHRMTLADPVALPEMQERPAGTDTAEVGPDDILEAYLRARRAEEN